MAGLNPQQTVFCGLQSGDDICQSYIESFLRLMRQPQFDQFFARFSPPLLSRVFFPPRRHRYKSIWSYGFCTRLAIHHLESLNLSGKFSVASIRGDVNNYLYLWGKLGWEFLAQQIPVIFTSATLVGHRGRFLLSHYEQQLEGLPFYKGQPCLLFLNQGGKLKGCWHPI